MNRDFEPEIQELADLMRDFMNTQILPSEAAWATQRDARGINSVLPIVEELRRKSARRGLWNLLQPQAAAITQVESAKIARITGWSPLLAPETINSQDPDYGNMNVLNAFANEAQRETWLEPLFDGTTRS
ncbi:MAG: acyl-CoA dehydrogenase, partial [Actinomycetales bacterium]|nr:acyl-CoA dehydrogenase [Actinomycetales bacterium]